jgi:hypothetical protein
MPKVKISEFSPTPSNNTDIDGINIAEGCAPSGINDAIRELMSQLKDFQAGTAGDSFNGPIGTTTAAAGVFTTLSASGTLGVTGVATLGNGAILGTPASVTLTNATGLPIATGVSGLGTGVATALAVNVGSAGAPVLFNGALGTPSSGTVTNLTGTASININGTVGATTASTGAFTTLTTSGAVTHNAGTANGVAYLNGSKVLTTGNLLTSDGASLGIGNPTVYGTRSINSYTGTASSAIGFSQQISGFGDTWSGANNSGSSVLGMPTGTFGQSTPNNIPWTVSAFGSEQMRLTSTGLGIGTSSVTSGYRLEVSGAGVRNTATNPFYDLYASGQALDAKWWRVGGGGADFAITSINDAGSGADTSYRITRSAQVAQTHQWSTTGSERMRLNASGNLGLGVTPSAWESSYRAFQYGAGSAFLTGRVGTLQNRQMLLGVGASHNGTNWLYTPTGVAVSYYAQTDGSHQWFTAPSGTAGNAITFTQAMTLDASGTLGVGTTSPTSGWRLDVQAARALSRIQSTTGTQDVIYQMTNTGGNLSLGIDNSTGSNQTGAAYGTYLWSTVNSPMVFATNNTERARIDSSGNLIHAAPTTPPTLATNGQMVFNLTSNTNLRVSVRGSDGVTRTANITLA